MKLEFPNSWVPYGGHVVERIFLCKVFHVYTERNEWANWHGDTWLVDRTDKRFYLSFSDCKSYAERNRVQGTRFIIDEVPSLCSVLKSNRQHMKVCIICTELFERVPFAGKAINVQRIPIIFRDIIGALEGYKWFCFGVYHGDISGIQRAKSDDTFFRWISKPSGGGRKVPLGWTTKGDKIEHRAIIKMLGEFKKEYNKKLQAIKASKQKRRGDA